MTEVRYHINPETGNAGKCDAKTPATCRFRPAGGEPPPHYTTPEEARAAYEQEQCSQNSLLPAQVKRQEAARHRLRKSVRARLLALGAETQDSRLEKIFQEAAFQLDEAETPLDFSRIEALEAAASRDLYRQDYTQIAVARRMALHASYPLINAYHAGRFSDLSPQVAADPAEAWMRAENELLQEVEGAKVYQRWPDPEDNAVYLSYANGRQATVQEILMDPTGEQHQPLEDGTTPYQHASWEAHRGAEALYEVFQRKGSLVPDGNEYDHALDQWEDDPDGWGLYGVIQEDTSFELVGAGIDFNAYLHKPTGLVYKVPHHENGLLTAGETGDPSRERERKAEAFVKAQQEAYAAVDNAALKEEGVEYCPTLFLKAGPQGRKVSFMVQPYLNGEDWTGIDLYGHETLARRGHVTDLHDGNVRVEKATGRVVIFDGLVA